MEHIIHQEEFNRIIRDHIDWQLSNGRRGKQADFRGKTLEHIQFGNRTIGIELRDISFEGATIRHFDTCSVGFSNCNFDDATLTQCHSRCSIQNNGGQMYCPVRNCSFRGTTVRFSAFLNLTVMDSHMDGFHADHTYFYDFSMQRCSAKEKPFTAEQCAFQGLLSTREDRHGVRLLSIRFRSLSAKMPVASRWKRSNHGMGNRMPWRMTKTRSTMIFLILSFLSRLFRFPTRLVGMWHFKKYADGHQKYKFPLKQESVDKLRKIAVSSNKGAFEADFDADANITLLSAECVYAC